MSKNQQNKSTGTKVILERRVHRVGPYRPGVLYAVSDPAEAERLIKVKGFRRATEADEKRCTEALTRTIEYTVSRGKERVTVKATGYVAPKHAPAPEAEEKEPDHTSAGDAAGKQEEQ